MAVSFVNPAFMTPQRAFALVGTGSAVVLYNAFWPAIDRIFRGTRQKLQQVPEQQLPKWPHRVDVNWIEPARRQFALLAHQIDRIRRSALSVNRHSLKPYEAIEKQFGSYGPVRVVDLSKNETLVTWINPQATPGEFRGQIFDLEGKSVGSELTFAKYSGINRADHQWGTFVETAAAPISGGGFWFVHTEPTPLGNADLHLFAVSPTGRQAGYHRVPTNGIDTLLPEIVPQGEGNCTLSWREGHTRIFRSFGIFDYNAD